MIENLKWHQKRVNETFEEYLDTHPLDLANALKSISRPEKGTHKIRIVYAKEIKEISIQLYIPKSITKLRVVEDNDIDYSYKFHNRTKINAYTKNLPSNEDIIIVKNGFITDSSYSNLAFFSEEMGWVTPATPLLNGTRRQKLLSDNRMKEMDITLEMISMFEKVSLINAMLDLGEVCVEIERIRKSV